MRPYSYLIMLPLLALLAACGSNDHTTRERAAVTFGEATTAVILINPVINQGSTTSVEPGSQREGVIVGLVDGEPEDRSDATGLAVLVDLPTGEQVLDFGNDRRIPLNIQQENELYDVAVSFTDDDVELIIDIIRYPIGGEVVHVAPGDDISAAANVPDAIVVLEEGTYTQDVSLRADGVLVIGAWSPEDGPLSIIEGDLEVRGRDIRMRGIEVTGKVQSNGHGFAAAFNRFGAADIRGHDISLLRNWFPEDGDVTVPSGSAVLVDNRNIP